VVNSATRRIAIETHQRCLGRHHLLRLALGRISLFHISALDQAGHLRNFRISPLRSGLLDGIALFIGPQERNQSDRSDNQRADVSAPNRL
jgi:hypothetical protein